MKLSLIAPPDDEPLSAAEARLRVASLAAIADDSVVLALVTAARQGLDGANGWLGRAIMTQTWELLIDRFYHYPYLPQDNKGFYPDADWWRSYYNRSRHEQGIIIPLPPLQSITSVKYLDSDDVLQTLDPSTYLIHKTEPARMILAPGQSWPSTSSVPGCIAIRFVAGYGDDGSDVDERIRTAIAVQANYIRSLLNNDPNVASERLGDMARTYSGNATKNIDLAVRGLVESLRVVS